MYEREIRSNGPGVAPVPHFPCEGLCPRMPVVVNGQVILRSECTIAGVCFDIKEHETSATLCAVTPSRTNARAVAATTRAREKRLRLADAADVQADVQDSETAVAEALGAVVKRHEAAVAELDKPVQFATTTFSFVLQKGERVCFGNSVVEFVPDVSFERQESTFSISGSVSIRCSTPCLAAAHGYVFTSDMKYSFYLSRFNENMNLEKEVLLDVNLVEVAIGYSSNGFDFDLYVLGFSHHQGKEQFTLCRLTPDCIVQQQLTLSAELRDDDRITHLAATETDVFLAMRDDETDCCRIIRYGRDLVVPQGHHYPGNIQAMTGLGTRLYLLMDDHRLLGFLTHDLENPRCSRVLPATWLIAAGCDHLIAGSSEALYVLDSALSILCELKESIPEGDSFASTCANLYVATGDEVQVYAWTEVSRIVNANMLSRKRHRT